MSKSFHVTKKSLTKYSKKELDEMVNDPDSELAQCAQKIAAKKQSKSKRKAQKNK